MAATIIEVLCVPGTTAIYAEALAAGGGSAAGTGTPSGSPYSPTQLSGLLHQITVNDALVGRWGFPAGNTNGDFGFTEHRSLTDTADRFVIDEQIVAYLQQIISDIGSGLVLQVWDALLSDHQTPGTFGARWQEGNIYENTDADIQRIVRGDSYDDVANDKLEWAVTKDFSGWTGTFTIRHRTTDASLCSASITVVDATTLKCTLATTDTAFTALTEQSEFGPHPYDVQMKSGGNEQTIVRGVVIIERDQTTS